ncbi:MAG: GDSL-type esterase/lipase family protein [Planctomycetota bacterium]|nr:GDSL-type esterase/lipase family protein [Planctomycetota bacterium]
MNIKTLLLPTLTLVSALSGEPALKLNPGDRIAIIGNGFGARMRYHGQLESLIHTHFPSHNLTVRNFSWAGEEPVHRFRPHRHEEYGRTIIDAFKPNVFILCFGMNASFRGEGGLNEFRDHYHWKIKDLQDRNYDSNQRFVLVSPIAQASDPGGKLDERNKLLMTYADMVKRIAGQIKIPFVDLYQPSRMWYQNTDADKLTHSGIHLSERGYRLAAAEIGKQLFGVEETAFNGRLTAEIRLKSQLFYHRYQPLNGRYTYSDEKRHYGDNSFKEEAEKLDQILAVHDQRIWSLARGDEITREPDYSKTIELKPEHSDNPASFLSPAESLKSFEIRKGYQINTFASEEKFPELRNPSYMVFDNEGRLWVSTMPGYPQFLPGSKFEGKILILEDTDSDGRADKSTVFADGLHHTLSFELGHGGAYVSQNADLLFLKDTNGDGRADERLILLQGFGTEDSIHGNNTFVWGPEGALYFQHGNWIRSQVETPYGVKQFEHSTIVRYEPKTHKLEAHSRIDVANTWGHVFDRWGQNFVAEPMHSRVFHVAPVAGRLDFPHRHGMTKELLSQNLRPISGLTLVSSSQFLSNMQGNLVVANCLNLPMLRVHSLENDDSTFKQSAEADFLKCKDKNFRPVGVRFGPDGALYIADWCNPIIGHVQHSFRHPDRDNKHGRIWRVTHVMKPLLPSFQVKVASIPELLNQLRLFEDEARYRARRELGERDSRQVVAAVKEWMSQLSTSDPDRYRLALEGLWVLQQHHSPDEAILNQLLFTSDYRIRAAATRVLRYWLDEIPAAAALLTRQANDPDPRVRLEAINAASAFHTYEGTEIVLETLRHHRDYALLHAFNESMRTLEPYIKSAILAGKQVCKDNPAGIHYILDRVNEQELVRLPRIKEVCERILSRDVVGIEHRKDALEKLAGFNNKAAVQLLMDQLRGSENEKKERAESLCSLLPMLDKKELLTASEEIKKLAGEFPRDIVRETAIAALLTATGDVSGVYEAWSRSVERLADFVNSTRWLKDQVILRSMESMIRPLLKDLPEHLDSKEQIPFGRYVRVELPHRGVLTLAEVEVFSGGKNVAGGGMAQQSSIAHNGSAHRAIDGNTDGIYGRGTSTHTDDEDNPWWEVDLGGVYPIDSITIWNRTEENLGDRLNNFKLTVLDRNRKVAFVSEKNPAPKQNVTLALKFNPVTFISAAAALALPRLPNKDKAQ